MTKYHYNVQFQLNIKISHLNALHYEDLECWIEKNQMLRDNEKAIEDKKKEFEGLKTTSNPTHQSQHFLVDM